jgi:hypothetical protein
MMPTATGGLVRVNLDALSCRMWCAIVQMSGRQNGGPPEERRTCLAYVRDALTVGDEATTSRKAAGSRNPWISSCRSGWMLAELRSGDLASRARASKVTSFPRLPQ